MDLGRRGISKWLKRVKKRKKEKKRQEEKERQVSENEGMFPKATEQSNHKVTLTLSLNKLVNQ